MLSVAASPVARKPARPLAPTSALRHRRRSAVAPISATVLTKNSEAMLAEVLEALSWCDEVVVFDTGSTDTTEPIAASYSNVSFHRLAGPFSGFGQARRQAVALARNDWILSVDSDEVVSPGLRREIASLALDPQKVYVVPFRNYYNGKLITTCGWAPDRHERLFCRRATNFSTCEVHERVQLKGMTVVHLRQPICHYSYRSLNDFLRKMSGYSGLFAAQNVGRKRSGPLRAVVRSLWAFWKSYVLQRGIFQGAEGLVISAYKAQTVFWKYMMLHEANSRAG